jgi:hypothetical protein
VHGGSQVHWDGYLQQHSQGLRPATVVMGLSLPGAYLPAPWGLGLGPTCSSCLWPVSARARARPSESCEPPAPALSCQYQHVHWQCQWPRLGQARARAGRARATARPHPRPATHLTQLSSREEGHHRPVWAPGSRCASRRRRRPKATVAANFKADRWSRGAAGSSCGAS